MEERIYKVKERIELSIKAEGFKRGLSFEPSSSDVVIVGPLKSGSTWMQQIVHQLRTGGDDSFEDIMLEVPSLETADHLSKDLQAEQAAFPKCFKVCYWLGPKNNGKYIFIFRHPYSVAYSAYKWDRSLGLVRDGEISAEEYVKHCWSQGRHKMHAWTYFDLIAGWIEHRANPNVMFVFYEDLVQHREREIRRIAKFMKVHTEDNIRAALERSSFEYMKEHSDWFSAPQLKRICGVGDCAANKIRSGSTTEGRENLPVEVCKFIDFKWREIVQHITGIASYEELHSGFTS